MLIIDASNLFRKGRAQNFLDIEHGERIVKWFQAFEDVENRAKVVTLDEIKEEGWTLNISRYVLPPIGEDIPPLPEAVAAFKEARADTKKRKNATQMLRATQEQEWWADQVVHVMLEGKRALDAAMLDVGRLVAETLMYMEREERSGPDYHPTSSGLRKWASQRGSIYVGDQKLPVEHPRLRGPEGEVGLRTYEQLKNRGGFSEELLSEVLRGMSARKYEENGDGGRQGFRCDAELGVPPSGRGDGEAAEASSRSAVSKSFRSSRCT